MLESTPELSLPTAGATVAGRFGATGLHAARLNRRGQQRRLGIAAQISLLGLVALSVLLVLLTAAHPNFMTPTANPGYFPAWMAGPLGGLWPRHALGEQTMHTLVTAILVAMYLAYIAAVTLGARLRARWVLGAILATHLAFLLAPPLQYTDVFNYINYARMGVVDHLDPYVTVPLLEPHGDPAFALSNWHWLVSPYGPLFTLLTYALVPLGVAGGFWALKCALCLSSLAVLALVWRSAQMLGRSPVRAVALAGLNPIVLVWGLGADHNDIFMVLPLAAGVYLLIRARAGAPRLCLPYLRSEVAHEYLAAFALVAASGIKASAAVAIPIAFVAAPRRRAFAAGLLSAAAVLGFVSILAFGAHLPGISSQTQLVTEVGPANLLGWVLGQGGETDTLRTVLTLLAGAFVLYAAALAGRSGKDWIALAGASLFVVWIATSWFSPWYIVWILPFAALAARGRLAVVVLAFGVYILLAFGPEITPLLHLLHFNPFNSALGREHSQLVSHLVQ
jgi:alpha-1,6-mannosyltransferase